MTSNSTVSFTEKLKAERHAKEQEINRETMNELNQLEQELTEETARIKKSTLSALRSAGHIIEKSTEQLKMDVKISTYEVVFYLLPLFLLALPVMYGMARFIEQNIIDRIQVLTEYENELEKIAVPGLKTWTGDGHLQVKVPTKNNQQPTVWHQEESDQWIIEIKRK